MGDVPTWVWQVVAAIVGGLGLGLGLGAVWQRGKKRSAKERTGGHSALSTQPADGSAAKPPRPPAAVPAPAPADSTPQQRLLERLRENNLQLSAQLRSAADEHARAMLDRTQEQQAERFRQERQIEELRQAHSAELSHLMGVLVERVDTLQKEHANHVKALEAELERLRGERRESPAATPSPAATDHAPTEIHAAEFQPTQVMDAARQP